MGFWERLIGSESGQNKDTQELLQELVVSHDEEQGLARQIRNHAERSPHQSGEQQLQSVAAHQDRVIELLHNAITAQGETIQQAQDDESAALPPPKSGKNHWARVVHDLDDNEVLMKRYGERGIYWDPDLPDAASLFRSLQEEKSRIGAQLRDIALRADSHALD